MPVALDMNIASPTVADTAPEACRFGGLRAAFDWRRTALPVPRRLCHHLVLDVRKLPRRYLLNSLRLQLVQLTGLQRVGFACKVREGRAHIWYWDESEAGFVRAIGATGDAHNIAPWPEPLLRAMPSDGLHLIACGEGCEAVAIEDGELRRSRWFRVPPDDAAWAGFVRDAGLAPTDHTRPAPQAPARIERPSGWQLTSSLVTPLPLLAWGIAVLVALLGAALIARGLYEYKLGRLIAAEQNEIARIRGENAVTLALHKDLGDQSAYLAALGRVQPSTRQLELMMDIARSGLFSDPYRIHLVEWEYRSERLRLQIGVPVEDFSLGDFLAQLEKLPGLTGIRLMPDSPRGTIGIQANVGSPPDRGKP